MRRIRSILALILAASALATSALATSALATSPPATSPPATSAPVASAQDASAEGRRVCEAKADQAGITGANRATYLRECEAGERLVRGEAPR